MGTSEDDRRKEYELLRTEMRGADHNCHLIVASLAAITGAVFLNWDSAIWYAGLTLQIIWLFGIMYLAERRFTITRIANYIREYIENNDTGFNYETVMYELVQKRPTLLITPLYRETALGMIVSLLVPFIGRKVLSIDNYFDIKMLASFFFGILTTIIGVVICMKYRGFRNK